MRHTLSTTVHAAIDRSARPLPLPRSRRRADFPRPAAVQFLAPDAPPAGPAGHAAITGAQL